MSWYSFRPYVSAAERRRKAEASAKKMAKKAGRALAPVVLAGKKIASTFWGKAWCDNLESYSDYSNRLPRGRSYVRNGSVIDLQISAGKVVALVQGSSLYTVNIALKNLPSTRWAVFIERSAGKVTNLLDLLQGRLSPEIIADITAPQTGLFPSPKEISMDCSCPDWAGMCKHVAAVLYGVGARLDSQPELFFTLRGVAIEELTTAASAQATAIGPAASTALDGADLSEIFGVELESASAKPGGGTASLAPKKKSKVKPGAKSRVKAKNSRRRAT